MTVGVGARLVLLAALFWVGARGVWQMHLQYRLLQSLPSPQADPRIVGAPLRAATGVDPWNHPVLPQPPAYATRFVLFAIRDRSLDADMAFWGAVQSRLRPSPGFVLVGYCDGWECGRSITSRYHSSVFPLIEYGETTAMTAVWHADVRGQCLILDRRAIVLSAAGWRHGVSPAQMAETLLKEIQ